MRLTISTALVLALFANLLPGCDRTATDREEAASKGASGQSSSGAATGQASEGSTQDKRTKY